MKKRLFVVACLFSFSFCYAQAIKKYAIGNSGCSAYFYCDPGQFDVSYSDDSSKVYTGLCEKDSSTYGVVCVKLATPFADITMAENVLIQYMDFLKNSWKITSAAGYGKGHRLRGNEEVHGVIDYWKDTDNNKWKVKGWTDRNYMVILFTYSNKDLSEQKANVFLDSILMK